MTAFSIRRPFVVTALAVCIAAVLYWTHTMRQSVTYRVDDVAPAASQTPANSPTKSLSAVPATVHAAVPSAAQAPVVAVPASVRQILPKLESRVDDWRTYRPQQITISPYADLAMEFQMTSVRQEAGRTVWKGRNALTGAFLVTVATQNDWHAVLEVPAASSFEFHIAGQSATVTENADLGPCGSEAVAPHASLAEGSVTQTLLPLSLADATEIPPVPQGPLSVDVLFFYDGATLAANGGSTRQIETRIAALLESANTVLENSSVSTFRWRYVAAYQVPGYTTTASLLDDLNTMTSTSNATGRYVADKCALHGVDQAVMFVGGSRDYAGMAWVPNTLGSVAHQSVVVWGSGYTILAHELAHNFGCRHDRQTENAPAGDGKYWYGYRFQLDGGDTGTVMSYAPARVPYFSNPDVNYSGHALGVCEDDPLAANDSRVLRDNAAAMAAYREAPLAPIISTQPKSTKVNTGGSFTLGVSASGADLKYQWCKGGVPIAGATGALYSKSGAAETDVGSYDVTVYNSAGTVTSSAAAVEISNEAAASPAAASAGGGASSAGGGGGGGAMSHWAMLMLSFVAAARFVSKRRNA